jgi:hypothetical protein
MTMRLALLPFTTAIAVAAPTAPANNAEFHFRVSIIQTFLGAIHPVSSTGSANQAHFHLAAPYMDQVCPGRLPRTPYSRFSR